MTDSTLMYDPRTALIVVDVQNDFAHPEGSLFVRGAGEIIPRINAEMEKAVGQGGLVFLTQDWHPERTPHFETDGGVWPVHCVAGTWGAEFHEGLAVPDGADAPVVRKGVDGGDGYSGFTVLDAESGEARETGLRAALEEAGARRVAVVGLATDYCVKATVLDALRLGYGATVLLGCTAAVELATGDGEAALEEMRAAGAVIAG